MRPHQLRLQPQLHMSQNVNTLMDSAYDNFQNHQTVKHTYKHPVKSAETKNMEYYSTLRTSRHPVNAVDQEITDYSCGTLVRTQK